MASVPRPKRPTPRRPRRRQPVARPQYRDLATYIAESGDRQKQIAFAAGTTQAHISRIVNGDVVPRPQLAARIALYCGIPLDSFSRVYLAKRAAVA